MIIYDIFQSVSSFDFENVKKLIFSQSIKINCIHISSYYIYTYKENYIFTKRKKNTVINITYKTKIKYQNYNEIQNNTKIWKNI